MGGENRRWTLEGLIDAYWGDGLTFKQVGALFGITGSSVKIAFDRNGLPRRRRGATSASSSFNRNHRWKGDAAISYSNAHHRVRRLRGTPNYCEHCKRSDTSAIYEWANLTGNYYDPADYIRLCRRCHKKMDRATS